MKTILVDAVYSFIVECEGGWCIFKELHDLLETYPNNKVIVTNAPREKFGTYGLDAMPYEVFTLESNPEKKQSAYFTQFLTAYNLHASDVLYFEHDHEAVQSAQHVGIVSFQYDATNKDLVALKTFIDTNLAGI